jgi:hypothetical protein
MSANTSLGCANDCADHAFTDSASALASKHARPPMVLKDCKILFELVTPAASTDRAATESRRKKKALKQIPTKTLRLDKVSRI